MTDVSSLTPIAISPSPIRQGAANAAGAVASGSIATGVSIAIKLELNRRGFHIDDYEATALVPVAIVVIHPIGQIINALVARMLRCLNKEE